MIFEGKIIAISELQLRGDSANRFGKKGYCSQQVVISTISHEQICISVENERCDWINNLSVDDWIEVYCMTKVIKFKSGVWFHKNDLDKIIKHDKK